MKIKIFLYIFATVLISFSSAKLLSLNQIKNIFLDLFIQNLTESKQKSDEVMGILDLTKRHTYFSVQDKPPKARLIMDCILCQASLYAARIALMYDIISENSIINLLTFICKTANIESEEVCNGIIRLNVPILSFIAKNNPKATESVWCGLALQNPYYSDVCSFSDPRFNWTVQLPSPKYVHQENTEKQRPVPVTVAIISDVHVDPNYEPNGEAECNQPVCCTKAKQSKYKNHEDQLNFIKYRYDKQTEEYLLEKAIVHIRDESYLNLAILPKVRRFHKYYQALSSKMSSQTNTSIKAGYWGDYRNCDTPKWAYEDLIDTITKNHNTTDMVYFIGDSVYHGVWKTTYKLLDKMNNFVYNKMKKNFGEIPIVPIIGNHEAQPLNMFAPPSVTNPGLNTTWLYKSLAKKWHTIIPEDAIEHFTQNGEYSVLIKPGLRVISLNNNVAYQYNWWINYDPEDSKKHLEWLVQQLYKAEQAGEKVHILTHIPPGTEELTYVWEKEYSKIIHRFSSTIAAEFTGHTHTDEFRIYYDNHHEPVNVAWGCGSGTTYSYYNRNYKIATFDGDTFEPSNIATYIYNMTEANLTPKQSPRWFKLYDMKSAYGLNNLSAYSMHELVKGMPSRPDLIKKYLTYYTKQTDLEQPVCDNDCKLERFCNIMVTVLWDRQMCVKNMQMTNKDLYYL